MLEIKNLQKSFPGFSFGPVDLKIDQGSHYVLLGPSGSGKSLLLELIAGFQKASFGEISLNGNNLLQLPPHKRGIAMVFQRPALFQHLSVAQNIAFPMKATKVSEREIRKITFELAEQFSIEPLLKRRPASLSGGEAQRVSLARALAMKPSLIMLDEPLSSLDVQLRTQIRRYLLSLNKEGLTMLHVTHDYEEALRLSSHVGIIQNGTIIQTGKPEVVFRNPASAFVAELSGIRNYFKVRLENLPGQSNKIASINGLAIKLYSDSLSSDGFILINEDQIILSTEIHQSSAQNNFTGKIVTYTKRPVGNEVEIDIGIRIFAHISDESLNRMTLKPEMQVAVAFKLAAVRFLEL
ncbi:MAG: ABC transporter ATP-binding protein [Bacteroidales bacterium]|nr:ABC transporter ATP-binding protein [Bacteroidales bacterium]MDP2237806.1 ABC transporter ATP-binding protein [Bacteroidales bacterium]